MGMGLYLMHGMSAQHSHLGGDVSTLCYLAIWILACGWTVFSAPAIARVQHALHKRSSA